MNARTIQHPGIEIREIDMTEYKNTVTTNNAYVIGFSDRGPIYNYSWITSRSEFINLYGTPQTEAEKYLYYAVMSILNNGGTPVVSRMPYDNKQCKAYKALKIKYASIVPNADSEFGYDVNSWENDSAFSANAETLIDLQGTVGQYIKPNGFDTLYETLCNQKVDVFKPGTKEETPSGIITHPDYYERLTPETLKDLTYLDVLYSLSDDLRFRDDLANDAETVSYNAVIENIKSLRNYSKLDVHDKSIKNFNNLPSYQEFLVNILKFDSLTFNESKVSANLIPLNQGSANGLRLNVDPENKIVFTNESLTDEIINTIVKPAIDDSLKTYFDTKILELNSNVKLTELDNLNKQFGILLSNNSFWEPVLNNSISAVFEKTTLVGDVKNILTTKAPDLVDAYNALMSTNMIEILNNSAVKDITLGELFEDTGFNTLDKFYVNILFTNAAEIKSDLSTISIGDFIGNTDFAIDNNLILNTVKNLKSNDSKELFATIDEILTYYKIVGIANVDSIPENEITDKDDLTIFLQILGNLTFLEYLNIQEEAVMRSFAKYVEYKQVMGDSSAILACATNIESINSLKSYLTAKTNRHDRTLSGIITMLKSGNFGGIGTLAIESSKFTAINEVSTDLAGMTILDVLESYYEEHSNGKLNEVYTLPLSIADKTNAMVDDYVIFEKVTPKGYPSAWFDIFIRDCEYKKIDLILAGDPKVGTKILVNGENPSDLGVTMYALDQYLQKDGEYHYLLDPAHKFGACSGSIYNLNLDNNPKAKALDTTLANLYNDPYFKKVDDHETQKQQAVIDAHLLSTPELSYQYGVYLDSTDCVISNEQYDDLVTAGNFTKADPTVSKYGEDIDTANFIIVDKQKSIVDGVGSNEGFFITIIDPYDGLKSQRMLINPNSAASDVSLNAYSELSSYGAKSKYNWKSLFKYEINTLNALQHVTNADNIVIGEINEEFQLLDSWSRPLAADYYEDSISKHLMNLYPQIPLTDSASTDSSAVCIIDKMYSSHIVIAVCKTNINPSDGKITVSIVEQFFGSLFNEKAAATGASLYIGDIINANSNYIEFYRNDYVKPALGSGTAPAPYNKTAVPQFFIEGSQQLSNVCQQVGIDVSLFDVDNKFWDEEKGEWKPSKPVGILRTYKEYVNELKKNNIFAFNKKTTVLYNNHPHAVLTSFSKKDSQKIIVNTTGMFGELDGTTLNVAENFLIDMDRCISYIKNVDQIPVYFVADAGLSTIAQFCDNVVWDDVALKWVTQSFDPDHDPDNEDRFITDATSVSTWRKVVDKLDQISREIRKDCMTIIDAPRQLTLDGVAQKVRPSRPQNSWDDLVGEKLRFISGINSSYTAGYYNWLRATDEFGGVPMWLPPTCKVIGNYIMLNITNQPWLAPAGITHGSIQGVHGVSHNPNSDEEDQIYLKSWNYIKQYPFDGFVIEGQKTTLTKNSAFSRVNVRTLFLDLERFVANVARNYRYTVNNAYTREQFVHTLRAKFEDYAVRNGIYDYMIVCDESNNTPETIDANELRCAIYVKPARLVEFVLVDFIAAKSGANFSEITI